MPACRVLVLAPLLSCPLRSKYKHHVPHQGPGLGSCADDTCTLPVSLIQLFLRQKVPAVRQLVGIAGAARVVLILRAGLARGVEELHEFSEAVGHLGGGLVSKLLGDDTECVWLCSLLLAHGEDHAVGFPCPQDHLFPSGADLAVVGTYCDFRGLWRWLPLWTPALHSTVFSQTASRG